MHIGVLDAVHESERGSGEDAGTAGIKDEANKGGVIGVEQPAQEAPAPKAGRAATKAAAEPKNANIPGF